jgi:diadenosine tetraphosphate (Ap4A) HIT family hydrolase
MQAITGAVQSVMSAITPKKNESSLLMKVPPPTKEMKMANEITQKIKKNLKKNNQSHQINLNINTNRNNNINAGNTRFEPGGRQNLYSMFQSSSAEGGRRRNKRQTKKHRKSKKLKQRPTRRH